MFKRFQGLLCSGAAITLMFIANIGVGPNCWFVIYEPDMPKSLQNLQR
jgi:cyclic lactone autoinducer peptide